MRVWFKLRSTGSLTIDFYPIRMNFSSHLHILNFKHCYRASRFDIARYSMLMIIKNFDLRYKMYLKIFLGFERSVCVIKYISKSFGTPTPVQSIFQKMTVQ